MDNFDLRKYLVEGKQENNNENKGVDAFIDSIPDTKELISSIRDLLNDLEGASDVEATKEISAKILYYSEEIDNQVFGAGLNEK